MKIKLNAIANISSMKIQQKIQPPIRPRQNENDSAFSPITLLTIWLQYLSHHYLSLTAN